MRLVVGGSTDSIMPLRASGSSSHVLHDSLHPSLHSSAPSRQTARGDSRRDGQTPSHGAGKEGLLQRSILVPA